MLKKLTTIILLTVSSQTIAKPQCDLEWDALKSVKSQLKNRNTESLRKKENRKYNEYKFCREESKNNSTRKYDNPALSGTITFDYSNNDGRYLIGNGIKTFEIDFSSASNNSIHVYKDPKSIKKIALAYEANNFSKIGNAEKLDYTSRTRTPRTNEIVILVNQADYYAAIKIIEVEARSHGKKRDKVTFSYLILNNKSSIFK